MDAHSHSHPYANNPNNDNNNNQQQQQQQSPQSATRSSHRPESDVGKFESPQEQNGWSGEESGGEADNQDGPRKRRRPMSVSYAFQFLLYHCSSKKGCLRDIYLIGVLLLHFLLYGLSCHGY